MQQANQKPVPLKTIREVKPNTFIFEQPHALSPELCKDMVARFEAHNYQTVAEVD